MKEPNPIEARRAYAQIFAYFADDDSKKKHIMDVPDNAQRCTYPICNKNTRCVYGGNISSELQSTIEKLIEYDMYQYIAGKNPQMAPENATDHAKGRVNFRTIHGDGFYDTCTMGKMREIRGSEKETKENMETRRKNDNFRRELKAAKRLISEGRSQLKSAEPLLNTESYDTIMDLCYSSLTKSDLWDVQFINEILPASMEAERAMLRQAQRGQMKKYEAVDKIQQGLKTYIGLLTNENLPHFTRIKTAIGHTLNEFEEYLPESAKGKYHNALFTGPE